MRWLNDGSTATLTEALRAVAPELRDQPIVPRNPQAEVEPMWAAGSAAVGAAHIVKFAWSRPAATRLVHEITVLDALRASGRVPFLPEVAAASTDPALLVLRRVPGTPLFPIVDSIDRDRAGAQLARFLVALHDPATRDELTRAIGTFPVPPGLRTEAADVARWVPARHHAALRQWRAWADALLATPGPSTLVHSDLHGDNQVWCDGELRAIVDFETVWLAEPEYDLRALTGTGPGVELLLATMRHYERLGGRPLSAERVLAWHVREALGDIAWRRAAGIALPDRREPEEWLDDLAGRFAALGVSG